MALLSRKAAVAKGALLVYLGPRLAQDAKIDFNPILAGINQRNFKENIPVIEGKVRAAVRPVLAQDADIEDLVDILTALEQVPEEEGRDAMQTDPNSGLPYGMTSEGSDGEPDDTLAKIKEFLRDKLSEEDLAKLDAFAAEDESEEEKKEREMWDRRGEDARKRLGRDESEEERLARERREAAQDARGRLGRDESDEEKSEREKRDDRARDARMRRRAKDSKRARDDMKEAQPDLVTVKAMDEAINTAVGAAEKRFRETTRAIRKAEEDVRPYAGRLALDSAESPDDVYRIALKAMGVKTDGIHPSAFKAVMEAHGTARQREANNGAGNNGNRYAQDSAGGDKAKPITERLPALKNIEVA